MELLFDFIMNSTTPSPISMSDFEIRGKDRWPEKIEYRVNHNSRHPASNLTMNGIIAIICTLSPHLARRTLNQLTLSVDSMLAMTGRVTPLGSSRWTEKGGSYRTIQRFKGWNWVVGVALATHQAAFNLDQVGMAEGRMRTWNQIRWKRTSGKSSVNFGEGIEG